MSESFNLIYSYTRAQAIEDGVLIYFHVLFQTSSTSEGKPVGKYTALHRRIDYIAALDGCVRITNVSSLVLTGSILLFLALSLLEIPVKVATRNNRQVYAGRGGRFIAE